ncbi:hypothetical protein Ahy_B01g054428 [Arachis hypogaea]|uniref:Aminotransferase-like plant mobile domain-containing protein n=1 Tax=Arachis hypogaea TaxID=3818 RepID=A0A445ATV7_ARAHY|nr:hypothetical protein Ahy_B01g054428 [Arachis hypogaea]
MAASSSQVAAQDKGKSPMAQQPTLPTLQILNQINDEIIGDPQPQIDDPRLLIPFNVGGETHCFVDPIHDLERANKRLHYFPNAQGEDLLISQNLDISFFINPQKSFKNNSKITPRGADFKSWHRHNEPVTDDEHVAFLFYWLNAIVFCSRSVQMQKLFLPFAALLHRENNFNLAKLVLGQLFEELGNFVNCLQKHSSISTGGLLWLFQFWLNAVFEKFMQKNGDSSSGKQHNEGF